MGKVSRLAKELRVITFLRFASYVLRNVACSFVLVSALFASASHGETLTSSGAADAGELIANAHDRTYRAVMAGFFPLVACGAGAQDFVLLRDAGFNGVVTEVDQKNVDTVVDAAEREYLNLVANVRDYVVLKKLSGSASLQGWYVGKVAEGESFPAEQIREKVEKIREEGSQLPTFLAVAKPGLVKGYGKIADVVLTDQTLKSNNFMIQLGKRMDEARYAGAGEVWAIIRIPGRATKDGVAYEEMKAMSYSAVVHGARGLFFQSEGDDSNCDIMHDTSQREDVKHLVRELGALSPYFLEGSAGTVVFSPFSPEEPASDGAGPVHTRIFSHGQQKVIIAVNVLDKEVKGKVLGIGNGIRRLDEYFSGKNYLVNDESITDVFKPREVKLYIAGKSFRRLRILDGRTKGVKGSFHAEVAGSVFERTLGLMFRTLGSGEKALLFPNEGVGPVWIHAPNMNGPFDIIFIDQGSVVSAVYQDVPPCKSPPECRHYTSPGPSKMVLELMAGTVQRLGIEAGDKLEFY
jgi:uncharacterized membrane protein (UPF0127 family)